MTSAEQIQEIETLVKQVLSEEPEFFLVTLRIKPTNNIKVYLDGDHGLPIEKCVFFNRKLYKLIEESSLYPEGDFSLELSSPGVDEPLKMERQFKKNVGRKLEITYKDDSKKIGTLIEVAADDIIIEETKGKGKKAVTEQTTIPFETITSAVVQTQF